MIITPDVVGIDISKSMLDIFDGALGRPETAANTTEAIAGLATRLARSGSFVVFEATGSYDLALRRGLTRAGVSFARINPARARDFANAAGFLAKTDRIDARMLAAFGQALRPACAEPADPARESLARLHRRRDQLVAMRQQERTRRKDLDAPELAEDLADHLTWLDQRIAGFDRRIEAMIAATPHLRQAQRLLRSIPGVGPVTAATLLALVPELGRRNPKTIAALAGLAPLNADSGQRRGQRCVRGGRKRVRDALYMAAVSASRSKTRFRACYLRLRDAGKPAKVALVAVARKLLLTANAISRDQATYQR